MARITKMPGRNCRFFTNGKCLYEEMLNSGYNRDWRCRVIRDLEGEYDRLLRQAEAFKLDEEAFTDIWEQRIDEHLKSTVVCRKMIPLDEEGLPFCAALWDDVCLLELEDCSGVCRNFSPDRD
ncbi:hypothetical protein [Maridesulfovibrio sp. FT414]|uniref:hypothetical protein n=1 Tax=Maridesulfovibrio sp. FT414 TaxID=2979469 RepID=UPI003D808646